MEEEGVKERYGLTRPQVAYNQQVKNIMLIEWTQGLTNLLNIGKSASHNN